MQVGSVRELWRYPVKSMMGERLAAATVDANGVLGDRGWAVRDEVRGGIRGAKKIGPLMRLAASYCDEPTAERRSPEAEIRLPDGARVRTSDPDVDAQVSKALDHTVTLWPLRPAGDLDHYRRGAPDTDDLMLELRTIFAREDDEPLPDLSGLPPEILEFESPPGTYFDAYALHILTTTSLRTLQQLAPDAEVDVRRFRPNILLDLPGATGFPEQEWVGRRLTIGAVEVEIRSACPRCVMITRPFAELPPARSLMRTVVREAAQNVGVYATVTRAGRVALDDAAAVAEP